MPHVSSIKNRHVVLSWFAVMALVAGTASAQTDIRNEPGGKRLLFVDGNDIRPTPGGKRLLFIDGDNIRPEPGGKRLLFVDGSNVRPDPAGIRLLFIDGNQLRRNPGSKPLLYVNHPNIRPDSQGDRMFFIDGKELTRQQLVAVLYQLKPELFKISKEEEARLKKEMAEAAADDARESQKDAAVGTFDLLQFYSSDDQKRKGTVIVARKDIPECKEALYTFSFQFKGEPEWEGVAIRRKDELWTAIGPKKTVALALYNIEGGALDGTWYPFYAPGTVKTNLGVEKLMGDPKLEGDFQIISAKAPNTGDPYAGTVTLTPHKIPFDGDMPYLLSWNFGTAKLSGVGLQVGKSMFVCSSSGEQFAVVKFVLDKGVLHGDFFSNTKAKGYYTLIK